MKKETKELVKKALMMADDKELLKFSKSYAAKDEAFATAIIEKFMPKDKVFDYETAIKDCFNHKKKGRARSWGPTLDWTTIRKESKALMKKVEVIMNEGDVLTAVQAALFFLSTLSKEFEDDELGDDYYDYEGKNFSEEAALDIICKAMNSKTALDRDNKLIVLERLKELSNSEALEDCLQCNITELVDDFKEDLLSKEDLLADLTANIKQADRDTDKENYIVRKIQLLIELNRYEEAGKMMTQHSNYYKVCEIKYDMLVDSKDYEAAKDFCNSCIKKFDNTYRETNWHIKKLPLCQKTNDVESLKTEYQWMMLNAGINTDKAIEYYDLWKELYDENEWTKVVNTFLNTLKSNSKEWVCDIYAKEGMSYELFTYISQLSTSYRSWYGYDDAGGKMLKFYSKYKQYLTEEQQQKIEKTIIMAISNDAMHVSDRKGYAGIARGLYKLLLTGSTGSAAAKSLTSKIVAQFPKKPAYKDELEQYQELFH